MVLPVATFAETSGTYVNAEGSWQSFSGVVQAVGEARPAWKVLRVLGNLLDIPGFDYATSEAVRDELHALPERAVDPVAVELDAAAAIAVKPAELDVPVYAVDALVRRAASLQQTEDAVPDWRITA